MTGTTQTENSILFNIVVPYDTVQPQTAAQDGQNPWSSRICTCQVSASRVVSMTKRLTRFRTAATLVTLLHRHSHASRIAQVAFHKSEVAALAKAAGYIHIQFISEGVISYSVGL